MFFHIIGIHNVCLLCRLRVFSFASRNVCRRCDILATIVSADSFKKNKLIGLHAVQRESIPLPHRSVLIQANQQALIADLLSTRRVYLLTYHHRRCDIIFDDH